jgi:starch synthase (maltosyl-transferring)
MEAHISSPPQAPVAVSTPALRRVIIEAIQPQVDHGRFAIKRTVGQKVVVEADIFVDGHEILAAALLYKPSTEQAWQEAPMRFVDNDHWRGEFTVTKLDTFLYTVRAWVDSFQTWARDFLKKYDAGQDVSVDLLIGAELVQAAGKRAGGSDAKSLSEFASQLAQPSLRTGDDKEPPVVSVIGGVELRDLMLRYPDRSAATTYPMEFRAIVDREKARFSSWYELFPRSCTDDPGHHGTFLDCIGRLDYVAGMGFDVLYLPPIHPIGQKGRKGKNNTFPPSADDTGSPWAIGSAEGGHKSIHPQLGTLADFKHLQAEAAQRGLELAIDVAFQCSPDHPYVKEHEEWFRHRPDGSIQYAENPPKKYEDIYPLYFENEHVRALCDELKSVVIYWCRQGIRIFRVDNPHTKPFPVWEWLIGEVRREYPDSIFLAEAFTRPKVMYRLAKVGFDQSYTYFAWKNTKAELTQYFTELAQSPVREFFRGNLWPNTPDILTEHLQDGGAPAFMSRLVLAGTLGANYGIYGPAFELCENRPVKRGSEEYWDSEKYQIRVWPIGHAYNLSWLIGRVNQARRENPALQSDESLTFHPLDNDQMIAYSKKTDDRSNIIVVIVNLDFRFRQSGWVQLPLEEFGMDPRQPFEVHDLLTDARFHWQGPRNYVELNPSQIPAHILKLR